MAAAEAPELEVTPTRMEGGDSSPGNACGRSEFWNWESLFKFSAHLLGAAGNPHIPGTLLSSAVKLLYREDRKTTGQFFSNPEKWKLLIN